MRNAYFLLVLLALLIAPALDRTPPQHQMSMHVAPGKRLILNIDIRF